MKKININILIIITLIILSSCSSEENSSNDPIIEFSPQSYFFRYMDYPTGMVLNPNLDNLVKINYNSENKIINRIGGIFYLSPNSGFTSMFTDEIYDEVSYLNNEIKIIRKTSSTIYSIYSFERKLILDNQNRIIKKIIYQQYANPTNDTISYFYNNLGLINESISGNINQFNQISKYYYNQNQNLDSIVTKKQYQNEPYYSKEKEIFSNYDNALNPLKKLILFEETFKRAISKNNFKKYEKIIYNSNNNIIGSEYINFNLQYDNFGNVRFELY